MNRIKNIIFLFLVATSALQIQAMEATDEASSEQSIDTTGSIYIQPVAPGTLKIEITPPAVLDYTKLESAMKTLLEWSLYYRQHLLVSFITISIRLTDVRLNKWLAANDFQRSKENTTLFIRHEKRFSS